MTNEELQEAWLKKNKPKKIDSKDDYLNKDSFNRSKKTYDELHQNKKVLVTNNKGQISKNNSRLNEFALQTLKNYNLKEDEEDYYIGKYLRIKTDTGFFYFKILRKEEVLIKNILNVFYICSNGSKFLERELRNRKILTYLEVDKTRIY
jgi:hypothetical protein